jgi:hypothetical protein
MKLLANYHVYYKENPFDAIILVGQDANQWELCIRFWELSIMNAKPLEGDLASFTVVSIPD